MLFVGLGDRLKKDDGFTLVEIMIVVAIIAALSALAIPNLLRSRVTANEAMAQATLKRISTSIESYAAGNDGVYPTSIDVLIGENPPYLNEDYTSGTRNGYVFSCPTMTSSSYSCTARPVDCGTTGTKSWVVNTGAVMTEDADCVPSGGGGGPPGPPPAAPFL